MVAAPNGTIARGVWIRVRTEARETPAALWGTSVVDHGSSTALIFGGEATLGLAHHRSSGLWALNLSSPGTALRPVAHVGAPPAARRQHAAASLPDGEMLVVGGQGERGAPLGEALTWSPSSSSSWAASGLEGTWAAALARAGHTLTPLPPPSGDLYLRGRADASILLFGGLSTPRVAALARRSPNGHSADEYATAAEADATEPDASLVALNDVLLLTRASRHSWGVTRLSIPDAAACSAHPIPLVTRAAAGRWRRRAASGGATRALQPSADDESIGQLTAWGEAEMGLLSATQLSTEEAEALQAARAPRLPRPCGRSGHSAHLYTGRVAGLPASACSTGAGGVGCLIVYAGAASPDHAQHGTARLDDLWLLPIDPNWARTRDATRVPAVLPWRALQPSMVRGVSPPSRAAHAAVLHGEWLYTLGGERPRSIFATAGGAAPAEDALWQLHLPSLAWTPIWSPTAAADDGLPRPRAGAAALIATLPARFYAGDGDDVEREPIDSIVLLGGCEDSREQLPVWIYPLGYTCPAASQDEAVDMPEAADGGGCPRGQQCDATRGACICADGGAPPCIRSPPPPPGIVLREGALTMIGHAWVVVGMSVLGTYAGSWSMRWGLARAKAP